MTRFVFNRRRTILGIGAALTMIGVKQTVAAGGDFASRLAEMQRDGRVAGLHAVLVARGNRLVFEYYGQGEDESWGAPLGKVTFGPTVLHDLRSVTKSILGLLYGLALAQGKVPPNLLLFPAFPSHRCAPIPHRRLRSSLHSP